MAKTGKKNIASIVRSRLCLGCGTCLGVCPSNALSMYYSSRNRTYIPTIEKDRCSDCGVCYEVCPGVHMNLPKLTQDITSREERVSPEFGEFIKCFVGHATDEEIRYGASSGGIATVLAIHLLESNKMDAVIATQMKQDSPLDTEPLIAKSRSDLINAMGSKYCPAATNSILQKIDSQFLKSCVFVGLPCHIQGIRNATKYRPLKDMDSIITIGLLCGGTKGKEGTRWILRKNDTAASSVQTIKYRGGGWPGGMRITKQYEDETLKIPYSEYYDEFFESSQPWRCALCLDRTSELADISLGDAWLPELMKNSTGTSLIIVRTKRGLKLLEEATESRVVKVSEVDSGTVVRSQAGLLKDIEWTVKPTLYMARFLGRKVPHYEVAALNPGWQKLLRLAKNMIRLGILRKMSVSDRFRRLVQLFDKIRRNI